MMAKTQPFNSIKTVHKIGGSCLKSSADFKHIPLLLNDAPGIIVASAAFGVTQQLLQCLNQACISADYDKPLNELIDSQQSLIKSVCNKKRLLDELSQDKHDIEAMLRSVFMLKGYSEQQYDWLLGYGEYWSTRLIAALLNLPWIDARQFIVISQYNGLVNVDWTQTTEKWALATQSLASNQVVIPGFVARDEQGKEALLGLNGSDYTAAIITKLIKADELIKWTDVDGIYSADPSMVKSAFVIKQLSYSEAAELAHFGASILHPRAVHPAIEVNANIYIRNSYKPGKSGTLINHQISNTNMGVKALSSIQDVSLITLEGAGFLAASGMTGRIFTALSSSNIPIILFCQASSEYSITLAIHPNLAEAAKAAISREFFFELGRGVLDHISITPNCAVIAAVGEGMSGKKGTAAHFFEALAKANINTLAIAQASSERNISAVIRKQYVQKGLKSLHGSFYLSAKSISIGLIGPGSVGSQLLEQISGEQKRLKKRFNIDLQIRGVMNSKKMVLFDRGSNVDKWKDKLDKTKKNKNLSLFLSHIASHEIPHAIIIDTTSSSDIARSYPTIFDSGCHLVTPNKKANSSPSANYDQLMTNIKANRSHYKYEATVCAGLPIISTIKNLIATGDEINCIEGVVSGTLSYVFYQCNRGMSFAESVQKAYALGYTEPDPRDDLNGLDVARKFICLAREIGYKVELEDVELLNLVPEALRNVSIDDFMKQLPMHQDGINKQFDQLKKNHPNLAYVGKIKDGNIVIQLRSFSSENPLANISETDNILMIHSKRYNKQPLVIQGPGAGAEVTAAGVFADILDVVSKL
jgi:bifunctional aspartokinase / homoserine dehydrogenase 1